MNRRRFLIITASGLLGLQAALTYGLARTEFLPSPPALVESIALQIGPWSQLQDGVLDPEVYEMLAPDDVINRTYRDTQGGGNGSDLGLFIAYYKSQLRAKNAHDPKVCLPGAGWNPQISKTIDIPIGSTPDSLNVNYYVIAKGSEKAVVLYWFQTHNRVFAREQSLKLSRIADNMLSNRTDMALVRIIMPVVDAGLDRATQEAIQFAQLLYPSLRHQFPPNP